MLDLSDCIFVQREEVRKRKKFVLTDGDNSYSCSCSMYFESVSEKNYYYHQKENKGIGFYSNSFVKGVKNRSTFERYLNGEKPLSCGGRFYTRTNNGYINYAFDNGNDFFGTKYISTIEQGRGCCNFGVVNDFSYSYKQYYKKGSESIYKYYKGQEKYGLYRIKSSKSYSFSKVYVGYRKFEFNGESTQGQLKKNDTFIQFQIGSNDYWQFDNVSYRILRNGQILPYQDQFKDGEYVYLRTKDHKKRMKIKIKDEEQILDIIPCVFQIRNNESWSSVSYYEFSNCQWWEGMQTEERFVAQVITWI